MKYIFDFDNTIVFTDEVNSLAYNEALANLGYRPLNFNGRITRKIVAEQYPEISKYNLERIIKLKQEIVIKNIHYIKINDCLIDVIKTKGAESCILWTSAEKERVNFILEKYNLTHLFSYVKYSDKNDIQNDINWFIKFFKCNKSDLCFIEDNENIIEKVKENSIKSVNVKRVKNIKDLPS